MFCIEIIICLIEWNFKTGKLDKANFNAAVIFGRLVTTYKSISDLSIAEVQREIMID